MDISEHAQNQIPMSRSRRERIRVNQIVPLVQGEIAAPLLEWPKTGVIHPPRCRILWKQFFRKFDDITRIFSKNIVQRDYLQAFWIHPRDPIERRTVRNVLVDGSPGEAQTPQEFFRRL